MVYSRVTSLNGLTVSRDFGSCEGREICSLPLGQARGVSESPTDGSHMAEILLASVSTARFVRILLQFPASPPSWSFRNFIHHPPFASPLVKQSKDPE